MMEADPDQLKECTKLCWECRDTCQKELIHHCLESGGDHVAKSHIKLMLDCIQICQTAADFMTRGSIQHSAICSACADICEQCMKSCEELNMRDCAEACRRCLTMCRFMGKRKNNMDQVAA